MLGAACQLHRRPRTALSTRLFRGYDAATCRPRQPLPKAERIDWHQQEQRPRRPLSPIDNSVAETTTERTGGSARTVESSAE